jgi:hypothetical protein
MILTSLVMAGAPFRIDVVDDQTGRGVPLIELETVDRVRYHTDSGGIVAIDDPTLMGREVFFTVRGHGYEHKADGFGIRGVRLKVEPGGKAEVKVKRLNLAERLYRVTGAGIYRDTIEVGAKARIANPLMNAMVMGSDSVQNARLGGRLLWFWGDTNWPSYPLGNFHTPGASSILPERGGLDPSMGVDLVYEVNPATGFAAETARMEGEGPTWISGLTVLKDESGKERLFCGYVKVKPPMEVYRHGLAEWDDTARRWNHVATFPEGRPVYADGHPLMHEVDGQSYVYFPTPYTLGRVPARVDALADPAQYEAFTCLEPGSKPSEERVVRDPEGRVVYAWRKDAPPVTAELQQKLLKSGALKEGETLLNARDVETGEALLAHGGSINWNEHRKRYVMVFVQAYGKPSFLGEVWYAEADSPLGPWAFARKIATHDDYSFYNPKQHPYFDQHNGRWIYFEGTYTHTFSGNRNPTPRYEYNQVMYRLDLDDPRLAMPVAFYRGEGENFISGAAMKPGTRDRTIAFHAYDRAGEGLVAVYLREDELGRSRLATDGPGSPLFHARPEDDTAPPDCSGPAMAPLWEWASPDGIAFAYRVGNAPGPEGWKRANKPLVQVWPVLGLEIHPLDR